MGDNYYMRSVRQNHDVVSRQCMNLSTELDKLVPLVKSMHLLSSNAVCSAARAGSEGDAFRVLTQDIQLLGIEVSDCISDTETIISDVVLLASKLEQLFSSDIVLQTPMTQSDEMIQPKTSPVFPEKDQQETFSEISDSYMELARSIKRLSLLLEPMSMLVKKGEYLSICSSVEAANSGKHNASFNAVADMLRQQVDILNVQSTKQRSLLRDLIELIDKQLASLHVCSGWHKAND